jgi:hypothetical protein
MKALTDDQISRFERDGFLNAGPVLSDQEVENLSAELDRILEIGPDGFGPDDSRPVHFIELNNPEMSAAEASTINPVWQIVNIWEASETFQQLVYHPTIVKAINQLTGFKDLQVWHDQIQYKPAENGGCAAWHQDAPFWPTIEPDTPVSAWIPFDDADIENGCMWMVPGSHKWGNQIEHVCSKNDHLKSLPEFKYVVGIDSSEVIEARPCPVRRGEIHFHHSLTWHGSPENSSPRPRRALAIHYMNSESHFTGEQHVMDQFIDLPVGAAMRDAGPHFPTVCKNGQPVACGV